MTCEHVSRPRYAPQDRAECSNRARWRVVATGTVLCGRHLRGYGRVVAYAEGEQHA